MVLAELPLWIRHGSDADLKKATSIDLWKGDQKCAIYSLDAHPPLLATAGGDGAVRLWNTNELFTAKHPGKVSEDGKYVSSSSSSSGESDDGSNATRNVSPAAVHDLSNVVRRKKDGSSPSRTSKMSNTVGAVPDQATDLTKTASKDQPLKKRRLLCTLSAHTGSSVLAIRFSPSGKYLASGGDDSAVCIYTESAVSEQWSRILLCRGHSLDVVDLAWAPDDSHLVSCSLDSETPIIVWKLTDLLEGKTSQSMIMNPFMVLGKTEHTSTVKGVCFDPAGSYFASSGDDPAICVWRARDDWGLEHRIGPDSGIFRTWKTKGKENNEDTEALSASQSMFRRLCWATDGSFICSTNAVVKNKHVASTISRDGWAVSTARQVAAGAANLVGHKQPVVVTREAPVLLDTKSRDADSGDESDDGEQQRSDSMVALGDRKGFVTIWSTSRSRPIFKLQCSETKSTVTDLSWGILPATAQKGEAMMLAVSLLDGQVVTIRFDVPSELGPFLDNNQHSRIFQRKYGIELDNAYSAGGSARNRKFLVGNSVTSSDLIENPFQMSLERGELMDVDAAESPDDVNDDDENGMDMSDGSTMGRAPHESPSEQQVETVGDNGKKRIRPVMLTESSERSSISVNTLNVRRKGTKPSSNPVQKALNATERVNSSPSKKTKTDRPGPASPLRSPSRRQRMHESVSSRKESAPSFELDWKVEHVIKSDLPCCQTPERSNPFNSDDIQRYVVVCKNVTKVPFGSRGSSLPCLELSLQHNGEITWEDQVPGTSCTCLATSSRFMSVGTSDGVVFLYGTAGSSGWASGVSFRSHPPLIFGSPIVYLNQVEEKDSGRVYLVVVSCDASFGVYTVLPSLSLETKGSLLPAIKHMELASRTSLHEERIPRLSRFLFTESKRLLVVLSYGGQANDGESSTMRKTDIGAGGSLQAFAYDRATELWMRVADSRFVLSDFYSSLSTQKIRDETDLSKLEDLVKSGSLHSSLESALRHSSDILDSSYTMSNTDSVNFLASRAHCEDRLACAMIFASAPEFKFWLRLYVRSLAIAGDVQQIRLLVDMLLGNTDEISNEGSGDQCWWLSSSAHVLGLDRSQLVRDMVVAETGKNRQLQRLTNEIADEVK